MVGLTFSRSYIGTTLLSHMILEYISLKQNAIPEPRI